jgi:hypothetical protein
LDERCELEALRRKLRQVQIERDILAFARKSRAAAVSLL